MAADGDKRTRYRLQSLATAVLLITLTVLLAWLSIRYPVQADWTRNGRYTLSAASAAVLKQAGGKLSVTAYARDQRDLHQAIRRFVAMYQKVKPDIELKFVNIDAAPERVRREGIRVNGELVVSYRGRSEHVRSDTEAHFTHAYSA
ncbi:MAG: Gldg family protein [Gammaproteobacteria bacterium]